MQPQSRSARRRCHAALGVHCPEPSAAVTHEHGILVHRQKAQYVGLLFKVAYCYIHTPVFWQFYAKHVTNVAYIPAASVSSAGTRFRPFAKCPVMTSTYLLVEPGVQFLHPLIIILTVYRDSTELRNHRLLVST